MSKLVAIVLTAAICLPLGALLHSEASADRRVNRFDMVNIIDGHRHLSRAQAAIDEARAEVELSLEAAEPLWSDKTGRAATTKLAVDKAAATLDRTAEWVRTGMARNDPSGMPIGIGPRPWMLTP